MRPCSFWNPVGLPCLVERDDLAVGDERPADGCGESFELGDDGGELRRLFVAETRPEATPAVAGAISAIARMPSYFGS